MKNKSSVRKILLFCLIFISGCVSGRNENLSMMEIIQYQLDYGPRLPGSDASRQSSEFFKGILEQNGWMVEFQDFDANGIRLRNVIAKNSDNPPNLIIGTHYDTRIISDQDPDSEKRILPVPGAIDGASGSALILKLSESIIDFNQNIWLVLFDGEDQGNINNWNWSMGAEYFSQELINEPDKVVILDMLGDENLEVYIDKNSDPILSNEIWSIAEEIGYSKSFIKQEKYAMIDDHLPFINKGIPAVLLIDFDYPYWHTTMDTYDKVSAENLDIVLAVIHKWVESQR